MQDIELIPLLSSESQIKKGHAHVYIWLANHSLSTTTSSINSRSSRSDFGHVSLRLFDKNGESISYADHGYISLYPSPDNNEKFVFKSQFQDFGSGQARTLPDKFYKICQVDVEAIQEAFEQIKKNNSITYSGCFFNGKGKFNCAELVLNLLLESGKVSNELLRYDLNEDIISVIKNHNNKLAYTLFQSCCTLLQCGLGAIAMLGLMGFILVLIAQFRLNNDPDYIEYEKNCEEKLNRLVAVIGVMNYVVNNSSNSPALNTVQKYDCSAYVHPTLFTEQEMNILLKILGVIATLGFFVFAFFICKHWGKFTKNAIVITPDSVDDLFNSVASSDGLISEEKSMLNNQLPHIHIDFPLSSSRSTLISSWSSTQASLDADKKEKAKNLFSFTK